MQLPLSNPNLKEKRERFHIKKVFVIQNVGKKFGVEKEYYILWNTNNPSTGIFMGRALSFTASL